MLPTPDFRQSENDENQKSRNLQDLKTESHLEMHVTVGDASFKMPTVWRNQRLLYGVLNTFGKHVQYLVYLQYIKAQQITDRVTCTLQH